MIAVNDPPQARASAIAAGDLRGANILVVGASGFLGLPLTRRLVALGAHVTGVSRHVPASSDDGANWMAGDAGDAAQAARLIDQARPDIVYILTSASLGGPDLEFVLPGLHSDLVATLNLLVEATRHGCKHVIMTGSLDEPQGPARTAAPATPYAAAKLAAGTYARMFIRRYGAPISILRPMITYGPGQKNYKVVPSTILALLQGRPARLSSGRRQVDWVYVDDMVEAFVRTACVAPLPETVDLGSGQLVSVRDCALRIGHRMGCTHLLEFDPALDRADEQGDAADTRAAAELLGWRATTTLDEGLDKTIAALQNQLARS